ncbi:M24 family metallopeptidase [Halorubrum sp. CBA1125]|uniref:M24 family metallopeptidase n=1 Tax=Halorubrum sp. CBA1125 TaxID=2668072 RepID=UPI0012E94C76|nr:Xaa-Pro peptidase family protein [Halorubrum sp. CBA1125]MUW13800.1 M24 family metallopeptidase [Halorubrum sp. CBA1125]
MEHSYQQRRERARLRLQERGADAAIAYPGPNLQYFTGFRGEPVDRFHALYLPADGEAVLVSPDGYASQAHAYADVESIHSVDGNDPEAVAAAIESLLPRSPEAVLLDDDAVAALAGPLYERLGTDVVGSAKPVFTSLRRRKDDAEIEALKRSAAVADAVSEEVRALGADAVGTTEAELATEIRAGLHARGAKGVSFDVVVGAGPNGADAALRHGDRTVRSGEPVVVDFGCFLDGYASDQTRVVVYDGDPPEGFEAVHEATVAALDAGVEAVEPGVTAGDVDAAVRGTLAERDLADRFTHGTGHGVGLASHEDLSIAEGVPTELEPGMVFSIEPGVYFDGEWGVRIEDLVVVTDDGAERLNDSPRTWRPL